MLESLEREVLKARFDVRGSERADGFLVVGIDAQTFGELNVQWPLRRSLHARAVRGLHAAGARTIVYDVEFTEQRKVKEDMALFEAIGDAGGAVLATSESDGKGRTNVLGGDENLRLIDSEATASDLRNDTSGAIARFPRNVAGLDSIAVVATKRLTGREPDPSGFEDGGAWIDYRGPPGTIKTVPFSRVLRGEVDPGLIRDRVVVVGGTAPTLRDVHPTPVGGEALMPGAEVQANAIWTALKRLPLRSAPWWVDVLTLALLALVPAVTRWRLQLVAVGAMTVVAAAASSWPPSSPSSAGRSSTSPSRSGGGAPPASLSRAPPPCARCCLCNA